MSPSRLERQLEVASLSGEVTAVMAGIVERLMELEGADGASLSTVDDEFAYFMVCAGEDAPLEGQRLALDDTLGVQCIGAGDVVVLRATSGPDVSRCLTPGAGAILLAPIDYDGMTRGVLGVRSADPNAFTSSEVDSVRLLSRGASVALRNAELVGRLAESERRYRDLYAQAADATLVTDIDGNLLDANDAASALLWYSLDDLRHMHLEALLAPGELAATPLRSNVLAASRELRTERRFRRKDGMLLDVECSARVLDDGRVQTSLRDVSQRKRNEERLRLSLGRLHAIVQTQQEISALELDPDAVTSAIVERAQLLAGGDGAAVQWLNGSDFVFHHAAGTAAEQIGLRLDRTASLAGIAAQQELTLYSSDTEDDRRVDADACRLLQARSLICAPLYRDGRAEGVLAVMAKKPEAFDELAVETTRLMAEFVSTVIRNANELETRRRLVEELRTQGQVVEHMQTALWVWEPDGGTYRLAQANVASERATGIAIEAIIGSTVEEVLPATTGELMSIFKLVVDTGDQVDAGEVEYGDERIEAGTFWVKAFPLPGGRIAMTFENVTEMSRARRALQESEERFRGAFHASSVGMTLTALDGSFVQVNDRFAEMLGYTTEELAALDVRTITHPDDLEPDMTYAEEIRNGLRESYTREKRYVRKDGSVFWGYVTVSLVRGYDGKPLHVVAQVQDVTGQKELETQLRQAQKMEAVGRLAGGIAHDFNNLLTAIAGYSEFLYGELEDDRLRRHAAEIKKAAARAASLTGQLLAFSRRQVLQPRVLDLNSVVSDMDMMLRRLIGEDVELLTMLEPDLASVQADPTQIEQVIVNLAVNARDAMPNGGSVTIETANVVTEDAEHVELRMTDTGVGMTELERQQLFDPFFTTKEGGTGLGLATVYGIVEQSGGTIEVESAPGMGSSFRIWLPRVRELAEVMAHASVGEAPRPGTETILLVEDEPVVRHLVAEILEASGYTVLQAGDGPSALELLRRHSGTLDLLVSDVVMPGMSGPEVAQAVTSMRPGTQVLYISGYTDSAIGHHGVLEPGIAFLQKPFNALELNHKVRSILDGVAAAVD